MTSTKHVRGVDDLGKDGILEILELSNHFLEVSNRRIPKVPALRGKTVASLFFEDSTRPRLSFEKAAKRLYADVMNFSVTSDASMSKLAISGPMTISKLSESPPSPGGFKRLASSTCRYDGFAARMQPLNVMTTTLPE